MSLLFMGWEISQANEWQDYSNYSGGKGGISRCLATVYFSWMVDLGTVTAPLTVSFSLLTCYNELKLSVKV